MWVFDPVKLPSITYTFSENHHFLASTPIKHNKNFNHNVHKESSPDKIFAGPRSNQYILLSFNKNIYLESGESDSKSESAMSTILAPIPGPSLRDKRLSHYFPTYVFSMATIFRASLKMKYALGEIISFGDSCAELMFEMKCVWWKTLVRLIHGFYFFSLGDHA